LQQTILNKNVPLTISPLKLAVILMLQFYFFTKLPGVYQMQCCCGGKWYTANVFCDTKTVDGGWTVIQRRKDGFVDFQLTME